MKYAKVIIDLSVEAVDKEFLYAVPEELLPQISPGVRVKVPFGKNNHIRTAFVTELTDRTDYDEDKIKAVKEVVAGNVRAGGDLIRLAAFMAEEYCCTMNQALLSVLPVKKTVRKNRRRTDPVDRIEESAFSEKQDEELNSDQKKAAEEILQRSKPTLLYGITGSGKTRVYIELIRKMQREGKQTIVLIPEISLTYQTVNELMSHLGNRVAVLHSKLTAGERYEQYMKAAEGSIDVMVGPRSALFAPFDRIGLIIIDEEHDRAYQSDTAPRYDAREVAIQRAEIFGARLVLGSATPSVESFQRAENGRYGLSVLKNRAVKGAVLPEISVVDMREELRQGNRNLFSLKLYDAIHDRLSRKEQVMLFLNRRGYAGFVSCRSCGYVVKCPHCDVSLTAHNNWYYDPETRARKAALLSCHYCGYQAPMPEACPSCGSRYIAPFGTGTQKLEQAVKRTFQTARVLRMDADSTAGKDAHEKILSAFRAGKADILIGTQMIVKGHDFPNVTLVGIVAADQDLNVPEYGASERTYQLLTQASGRAGRGGKPGAVVIQSYDPGHYAIQMAAGGSYEEFYAREISFRKLMKYPPACGLLTVRMQSEDEELLTEAAGRLADDLTESGKFRGITVIGPCSPGIGKINDVFRQVIYVKHERKEILFSVREKCISFFTGNYENKKIYLSFDIKQGE